jgi:NDP-sugar pyrophosphorylase family protein
MKAIILAGGKGTRLAPHTRMLPKPLVPLGDKPILDIILRQLRCHGITDITLAVGHLAEMIMAFCGNGERYGVKITYSREEHMLGTVGPLGLIALPKEPFLLMNGDVLSSLDFRKMYAQHILSGAAATVGICSHTIQMNLGVVEVNHEKNIVHYIEKPHHTYLVGIGINIFSPVIAEYIKPNRYLDLPHLINMLIQNGHTVCSYRHIGYWIDIGQRDEYEAAQADFEHIYSELMPDYNNEKGQSASSNVRHGATGGKLF